MLVQISRRNANYSKFESLVFSGCTNPEKLLAALEIDKVHDALLNRIALAEEQGEPISEWEWEYAYGRHDGLTLEQVSVPVR